MPMTLDWKGDNVIRHADAAVLRATEETLSSAVGVAQGYAPVLTGALRGSIHATPVQVRGDQIFGQFGAWIRYAIFVEIGARGLLGVHFLRRAADIEFSRHAERVKAAFK